MCMRTHARSCTLSCTPASGLMDDPSTKRWLANLLHNLAEGAAIAGQGGAKPGPMPMHGPMGGTMAGQQGHP